MDRRSQGYVGACCATLLVLMAAFYAGQCSEAAAPRSAEENELLKLRKKIEALEHRLAKLRVDKDGVLHAEMIQTNLLIVGGEEKGAACTTIGAGAIKITGGDALDGGPCTTLTNVCLELRGGDRNGKRPQPIARLHADWQDGARLRFERGGEPQVELGMDGAGKMIVVDRGPK